jgi:hypothetical protein
MKRIVAGLLAIGLLAGLLLAPTLAFANPLPLAPADGERVALYAYNSAVYEYPAASGIWYVDYNISNYASNYYSDGATIVDPMTSIQYLNAADVVLGSETFSVAANVLPAAWQPTSSYPEGYYRTVHHRLSLPVGADPSKTRMAVEVSPADPDYPKYHYGIASRTAVFSGLDWALGPIDTTTLGGGRTQFTLTVTNSTDVTVGPLQVQGNESFGPASNNTYFLNAYSVVANEPAKALRLGVGESTTFTIRGLRPTPTTSLRFTNWNLWQEAEPTDLYGTVSFRGAPLVGASVTIDGYSPRTTIFNGGYAMSGVVPGSHLVTFSKPGFMASVISVTTVPGSQISRDIAMSTYPSLTRSPSQSSKTYTRKHGKVSFTLSAIVKGIGSVPVGRVKVYLQMSKNGRTGWKNYGAVMSSSATGRVAKTLTSKTRSTRYFRWSVPAQIGVLATPHTSKQKIVVK